MSELWRAKERMVQKSSVYSGAATSEIKNKNYEYDLSDKGPKKFEIKSVSRSVVRNLSPERSRIQEASIDSLQNY